MIFKFSSLYPIIKIVLIGMTISQGESRKVLVWQNLQEFFDGGWYVGRPYDEEYPGFAFSKPSDVDPSLAPLDEGVTGNGVWSGHAGADFFAFFRDITDSEGMIEANVTVKFYAERSSTIIFIPCEDGRPCGVISNGNWQWVTFMVNLTADYRYVTFFPGVGGNTNIIHLIDEVILSYETDPNWCNESCEYRAIDCHNYYSCVNSYKQYLTCEEEDGLAFNPKIGMCDRMEFVEGCAPPPRGDCEYRPDLNNCSNYYFCPDSFNKELCELRTCPRGLHFNGFQCTIPSKANCPEFKNNA